MSGGIPTRQEMEDRLEKLRREIWEEEDRFWHEVDDADFRHRERLEAMADEIGREVVSRFASEYKFTFVSGNGTWVMHREDLPRSFNLANESVYPDQRWRALCNMLDMKVEVIGGIGPFGMFVDEKVVNGTQ